MVARNFDGTGYLQARRIGEVEKVVGSPSVITLAAWVKLDAGGSGSRTIFGTNINSTQEGIAFLIDASNKIEAGGRSVTTDSFLTHASTTALTNGVWTHVAAVINYASDTVTLYLNGSADGSTTVSFGNTSLTTAFATIAQPATIGATTGLASFFDGDICDVAIFRYDASAILSSLASGTRPDAVSGSGPCLYWPLHTDWDGKGVGNPRVGGIIMESQGNVGAVTLASTSPTLTALSTKEAWQKFDHQVRAMRVRASDYTADGIGSTVTARKVTGAGASAAVNGTPTYEEVSGRSVIRFVAASSEYLSINAGFFDLTKGISVVCLANMVSGFRICSTSNNTTDERNGFALGDLIGLAPASSTSVHFSSYTDYTDTNTALWSGRFSGSEIKNWLNGVVRSGGTPSLATERSDGALYPTSVINGYSTLNLLIARRHNTGSPAYASLDLTDLIIVEGAITDEELQYLEGCIAWENSATAFLPVGHPWKSVQPTLTSDIAYQWGSAKGLIARSHHPRDWYLGSPGICVRSNGDLIATSDQFKDGPHDVITRISVSEDNGDTWRAVSKVPGIWSRIWEHTDGNLYFLTSSPKYGNIIIRKSTDGGLTWASTTLSNGTLLTAAGSGSENPPSYISHSSKPLYYDGYIFIAHENYDPATFASGFDQFVLYADATTDLMNAANWAVTSQVTAGTSASYSDRTNPSGAKGYLEGNLVVDDNNQIWNVLRWNSNTQNKAVHVPIGWTGSVASFPAWSESWIKDMPGGNCKFEVIKYNGNFYAVTNVNTAAASPPASNVWYNDQRNRSELISTSSADLSSPSWASVQTIVDEADVIAYTGHSAGDSIAKHGFQYAAIDDSGTTLHVAWRVAWSGSGEGTGVNTGGNSDYHDSNFIGYSQLTLPSSGSTPLYTNHLNRLRV